ncbi:unnamed protein product, partial [Brenthis ino]
MTYGRVLTGVRISADRKMWSKCRLPTNILIRDEWVAAIRPSRNDPQWQPSSSVVCSDHFDEKDMYDTQRELRRIHRTGYPKRVF